MNRRIFAEKKFNIINKVVSYESFKPFIDRENGFEIIPAHFPTLVSRAEKIMDREYPSLIASDYMMFRRDGNRTVYQDKCFIRRQDILTLALAEYVEKHGKFIDKIINLIWMILEETSWVIPAHNRNDRKRPDLNCMLPHAYTGEIDYIDLFSAATAADLAWVYYLLKDEIDKVFPIINERLLFELDRRIIKPFLNPVIQSAMLGWSGVNGNRVNNWNPWIVSNVLTVAALTQKDIKVREAIVKDSMMMLDNFTSIYHDDGGCDEGPGYWGAAGGALFDACLVLYDMTNGYVNIYDDPLFKKMGEYEVKAVINGNRVLNFADCASKINPNPFMLYEWGVFTNSEMMRTFGQNRLNGEIPTVGAERSHPYRGIRFLTAPKLEKCDFIAPTKFWLDGIIIAGTRESSETNKGLYLAFKGGTNAESHNHNDVGNFIVYADGQPIFIDAGSGTYTKRTFSKDRYTIWAMRSDYHNCATINGVEQKNGIQAHSSDHVYDEATGGLTMNLKTAYPEEAGISSYTRSAVLLDGEITVTDAIALENDGDVTFNFLVNTVPQNVTEISFEINGRKITFDPALEYAIEELDKTWPEVEKIPRGWECDVMRRITLKNKAPIKEKTYVLTIK